MYLRFTGIKILEIIRNRFSHIKRSALCVYIRSWKCFVISFEHPSPLSREKSVDNRLFSQTVETDCKIVPRDNA